MTEQITAATFQIQINGQPLPPEVELVHALIEDSLHRPDSFELELRDIDRGLLERLAVQIGAKVTVGVVGDASPSPKPLIEGEVTAFEAEIDSGLNVTILRGYDQSHRLLRGRATKSFQNVSISDVATRVAQAAGLTRGTVESTGTVLDHIGQANQTDFDFIADLAHQVGFEFAVADGKFNFRRPATAASAPSGNNLSNENQRSLLLGSTLLRLRASVSSAGQVADVEARGWDVEQKRAVVGTARAQTSTIEIGTTPRAVAEPFAPKPMVAADVVLATLDQASAYAGAVAEEVAAGFAELEGVARGNPELKAGVSVTIGLVGKPFDGKYVLTSCRHVYDRHEGYLTHFSVSGRSDRSLYALAGGAASGAAIDGVVVGVVEDVDDTEQQCRVRLRFPWLAEDYVSGWARTVQLGAGAKRGFIVVPEVGDEVLVSFDRGDLRHPFVLGGLYNGQDKPELGPFTLLDSGTHAVNTRRIVSRKGHALTFSDESGKEKIQIASSDGQLSIEVDIANNTIKIGSGGKVELKATGDTTIESMGKLVLKGSQVEVEAQSSLTAKGATVGIEGQGSLEVKASGTVTVSGAVVRIN